MSAPYRPKCTEARLRRIAELSYPHMRRKQVRDLPWSRMTQEQQELAMAIVRRGRGRAGNREGVSDAVPGD